jgi:hypothetical protein
LKAFHWKVVFLEKMVDFSFPPLSQATGFEKAIVSFHPVTASKIGKKSFF